MSLSKAERQAIIQAAINETKAEFAGEVSKRTSLTTKEVLDLAQTEEERQALAKVLNEVMSATGSNTQKAAAISNVSGGVEALVKIAALFL